MNWNWTKKIKRLMSNYTRALTLFGLVGSIIATIVIFEILSSEKLAQQKRVGEALLPFFLGLGALSSGMAGFAYLEGWLSKQKKEVGWKSRFPIGKLDIDFKVIQAQKSPGILYIYDLRNYTKHWIVDPTSLRALELSYSDVETLGEVKFKKILRGENIKISE